MPLREPTRLARASSVTFILPDEREVTIPPVGIDAARRCLMLDPKEGHKETHKEWIDRVFAQAKILLGREHEAIVESLSAAQIVEVIGALYVAACGMDAEQFAYWQLAERQAARAKTAAEMLQNLDELTVSLGAELRRLPSEVGAMPLADAAALREQINKLATADINFQSALHGAKPS